MQMDNIKSGRNLMPLQAPLTVLRETVLVEQKAKEVEACKAVNEGQGKGKQATAKGRAERQTRRQGGVYTPFACALEGR